MILPPAGRTQKTKYASKCHLFPDHRSHHIRSNLQSSTHGENIMLSRPAFRLNGSPSSTAIPLLDAPSGITTDHRTTHSSCMPLRLATTCNSKFAACAVHCIWRNPSPPRPVSGSGSSSEYRSKIPTAFKVTHVRRNARDKISHPEVSTLGLYADTITPAGASPCLVDDREVDPGRIPPHASLSFC